jgi:hypothetical protein
MLKRRIQTPPFCPRRRNGELFQSRAKCLEVQSNGHTELASGLTYHRGGQWLDAVEQLESVRDGAASSGQTGLLAPPQDSEGIMSGSNNAGRIFRFQSYLGQSGLRRHEKIT